MFVVSVRDELESPLVNNLLLRTGNGIVLIPNRFSSQLLISTSTLEDSRPEQTFSMYAWCNFDFDQDTSMFLYIKYTGARQRLRFIKKSI